MGQPHNFICTICTSAYNSKRDLNRHVDSKHKCLKFECNDCGKQYSHEIGLTAHINSIHKRIKYRCEECDKEFTSTSSRLRHMKITHEHAVKKYSCSMCDYKALIPSTLKQHTESVHKGVKYQCPICGLKVSTVSMFEHKRKHKGVSFPCKSCGKEYKSRGGLNKHIETHKGKVYNCNICQYSSVHKDKLTRHIKSHKDPHYILCKMCDFKAKSNDYLKVHVENVHNTKEKVICIDCNKTFKKSSITVHRKKFHSEEILKYECKICSYQTIHKASLQKHVKYIHQDNEDTACNICNATVKQSTLLQHTTKFHKGDQKQFKCELCTFHTIHKGNLKTHINSIHNVNNTVVCTDCNKTMKQSSITTHRKLFHSSKQPQLLVCNICTFEANHESNLERHVENVHQQENVVCIDCNKTMLQSSLEPHRKRFHSKGQPQ